MDENEPTFLFLSDCHVGTTFPYLIDQQTGLSARSLDLVSPLEQVRDYASNLMNVGKRVILIIAGDLYDKVNPNPNARKAVIEAFTSIAKNAPIHVIGGNHDTPRELYRASSLDELALIENVTVHRKIEACAIEGKGVLFMPFIRPSFVAQLMSEELKKEMCFENRDQLVFKEIDMKVEEEYQKIKDCKSKYAVTHYYIKGMKYDSGFEAGKNEFVLPREFFDRFDKVFAGHIHKPQRFDNIVVIGSTEIISLAEVGQEKRMVKLEGDIISSVNLNTRKHVIIPLDYKGEPNEIMNSLLRDEINKNDITGAVVVIKVKCKLSERQAITSGINYEMFGKAFYLHALMFDNKDELNAETSMGLDIETNSDEGNFLSYHANVIEKDSTLDNQIKEKIKNMGLEIIKQVLSEDDE